MCSKCFRYYLYQRVLGKNPISFQHDPVKEGNSHLEKYVYSWQDRERNYWADVQYSLFTIVSNEKSELEPILQYYKDVVYPAISEEMPKIREQVLGIHPNKLLPSDWSYPKLHEYSST